MKKCHVHRRACKVAIDWEVNEESLQPRSFTEFDVAETCFALVALLGRRRRPGDQPCLTARLAPRHLGATTTAVPLTGRPVRRAIRAPFDHECVLRGSVEKRRGGVIALDDGDCHRISGSGSDGGRIRTEDHGAVVRKDAAVTADQNDAVVGDLAAATVAASLDDCLDYGRHADEVIR